MATRNHSISYIKGYAIIAVLLIHLIDWSNIVMRTSYQYWREWLYPAVLFFVATVGSLIVIAYRDRTDFRRSASRLFIRGLELIGLYFAYNLIKLWVYDFQTAPFYWQFSEKGTFDTIGVLTLRSFATPITIIFTLGVLLMISPLFLYIVKYFRFPKLAIIFSLVLVLLANQYANMPGLAGDILYSRGFVLFPIALWITPYLIGILVALIGIDKYRYQWFLFWLGAFLVGIWYYHGSGVPWPSQFMYPLRAYYVAFSFLIMFGWVIITDVADKFNILRWPMSILRFWGDRTLVIYIGHWIVIDITLWIAHPHTRLIWLTGPMFLLIYTVAHYRMFFDQTESKNRIIAS